MNIVNTYKKNKLQKLPETTVSEIEQSLYTTSTTPTYFGARYLDPRTSRWLSVDPAMYQGDCIPAAPINDEVRRNNNNLPGMGGIYNYVNMHVYHYGGNNPVKYVDTDGRIIIEIIAQYNMQGSNANNAVAGNWGAALIRPYSNNTTIAIGGCAIVLVANIAFTRGAIGVTPATINNNNNNFDQGGYLRWIPPLSTSNVTFVDRVYRPLTAAAFNDLANNQNYSYLVGIRVNYSGTTGNSPRDHWVGASELVTRNNIQYYRISPTSENDWIMGTNTAANGNNRAGRGWQTDTNAKGQVTDIYVPLDQVTGYIIYRANQNLQNN